MDISSFVLSLCAWFVMFVVLMLLFTWLSRKPGNAVVYYPSRILKGLEPWEGRSRNRHPFAWIQEALSSSEQDVIAMSGVDTAVYFVFLKTVLGILVLSGLVLLPVLLPVSATSVSPTNHDAKATKTSVSATKHDDTSSESLRVLNTFSMGNIGNNSDRLWAFLIAMYWVSFVTYYLLWKAYEHVSRLRADALMSLEVKPEQFAILVRDIPDGQGQTRKEQVELYFKTIYPDTYYRSIIITNNKKVNKIWKELEGYRKKLALAKAKNAESKSNDKPEGARPTKRTGFLGLFGKKVDIIEYYNEKINEIIPKLESEQKVTLQEKQQGAALVFFTSRLTAASAAQSLHARLVNNWTVIAAPEPRQLIWNNLKIKFFQRKVRQLVVSIIVPLIVSSLIPISLIYHLLGLEKLKIMDTTSLGDWLPQVAFYVILVLLRKLLAFLSKVEGIPSESHVVRAASGKYFYVIFLNIFIVAAATVTLDSGWKIRTKTDNPAVSWLGYILSSNAKFFMKFVALNIFLSYGPELLRLPTLILYHLKMKYWYKTEEQRKEACSPGGVDYGTRVPDNLLIFTIVQFYSITAPLIIPIGVAYFGVAWLVLRNQALKIYVPSYESYGRMWPHMHTRILTSLVLCQVTMLGSLGMRQFDYTPLLIPLPILSLLFGYTCSEKFYRFYSDTALEVACHPLNKVPNMDQVFKAFIPPSLRSENIDDDQFADAS